MTVDEAYQAIVKRINESKTELEHRLNEARRDGFKEALRACGYDNEATGRMFINADLAHTGDDAKRPMTAGVFHDWKPSA